MFSYHRSSNINLRTVDIELVTNRLRSTHSLVKLAELSTILPLRLLTKLKNKPYLHKANDLTPPVNSYRFLNCVGYLIE